MDLLAQVLVNGVLLGGLYAVMALGLALVWGVLNIVNPVHGACIMRGGYVSWYLIAFARIDPSATRCSTAWAPMALRSRWCSGSCRSASAWRSVRCSRSPSR